MKTTEVPPHGCPVCLQPLNAATDPHGEDAPKPGDITVCIYCATVLEMDAELRPTTLTAATRAAITMDGWRQIERMRQAIKASKRAT